MAGSARSRARVWIWIVVALVLLAAAFVGTALATDRAAFCPACHEMQPYYDAWSTGAHAEDAQCVDCHVRAGFVPRLAHKFVALQEVWAHFFGNKSFPVQTPPNVPNRRCLRCHPNVVAERKTFSHKLHASKGSCQDCHPTTGHNVTSDALKSAGAFNPNVKPPALALKVAVVNGGRANIPGHVKVVCSDCHDLKATGCRACHKPPHAARGDCAQCHQPGPKFVFKHPSGELDCSKCHKVPKKHPVIAQGKPCRQCHVPGTSFTAKHTSSLTAPCSDCHQVPAGHPAGMTGQCSQCHTHPGVSWVFAHRGNTGEHNYRSFACKECHPKSYTQASCTCHGGKPPSDD